MLKASGLKKKYGGLEVLKGIELTINESEVISIVGSSGAGKSTLLHILGTLDQPDEGTVELNGVSLFSLPAPKLASYRNESIGFVFQFHNLLPEFTALENVAIPGFIKGTKDAQVWERAERLLEILSVGNRASHKPSQLSGGEQQRVAVARAMINSPAIIFADEPSGNLDSKNAEDLHNLFFKLRDELNQTFVIVTHNATLAQMADRSIEIRDGKVLNE